MKTVAIKPHFVSVLIIFLILIICCIDADAKVKKYKNGDIYTGEWKKGTPQGVGTMKYANGEIYTGEWIEGLRSGGKMTYSNGDIYNGDWLNNTKEGNGKMIYSNGDIYEGRWSNNDKSEGKMIYSNGDIYNGDWLNNTKEGNGKMIYSNGDIYEGGWASNLYSENGILTLENQIVYSGEWSEGSLIKGKCYKPQTSNPSIPDEIKHITYLVIRDTIIKKGIEVVYADGGKYIGELDEQYNRCKNGEYSIIETNLPILISERNTKSILYTLNLLDKYIEYINKNRNASLNIQIVGIWDKNKLKEGKVKINDDIYEGVWENNIFEGECTLRKPTSMIMDFTGTMKDGKYCGDATYINNTVYKGEFDEKLQRSGEGRYYRSDMKRNFEGTWLQDEPIKGEGYCSINDLSFSIYKTDKLSLHIKVSKNGKDIYSEDTDAAFLYIFSVLINNIENEIELLKQKKYYEAHLKSAIFAKDLKLTDISEMNALTAFVDIDAIRFVDFIEFKSSGLATYTRACYIDKSRVRSYDRGYLLQQNMYCKKFSIYDQEYEYSIQDGIITLGKKEYKHNINARTLYNEDEKITLKYVKDLSELEYYKKNRLF